MKIEFGYGKGTETLDLRDGRLIAVLRANEMNHERKSREAVRFALENPIGTPRLSELLKPGMKVSIVASDISRPCPSWEILPEIVAELSEAGIPDRDIKVVFAVGSHRTHTEEEKRHLAGEEVYGRIQCSDAPDSGYIHLGTTSRGTPVDVSKDVALSDFIICTGNIEYHYFAGYSGGYKAIMPGCSTFDAIQVNHKMMADENAKAGILEENPLRMDIEEAGRMTGVQFIVNAVLDEHKNIVYAVAGDPVLAHRTGCRYLDRMYSIQVPEKADIVVVSQGGAPKDANLYQTQKAIENAKHAVKEGGTMIVVGACTEGFGSSIFEEWLRGASSPASLTERISREFKLGGHKAAAIGKVLQHAGISLVSEMPEETVRDIFMEPYSTLQEAFDAALEKYGEHASVICMPFGGATLPVVK